MSLRPMVLVAALVLPRVLLASGVTLPNTFSNGSVADATEVNENFTAIKTAVDDNHARIGALEAGGGSSPARDGSSPARAAASCRAIDALGYPSGSYWLDATPATPAGAFQVYCQNDLDGGGWMLVSSGIPVTNAGLSLCSTGAVGSLPFDDKHTLEPAKLADAVINQFWGPTKELLVLSDFGSWSTSRSAWTDACVFDFVESYQWVSATHASSMASLESTTIRCGLGGTASNQVLTAALSNAVYCGLAYAVGSTKYFIHTSTTSHAGGACTGNAGRGWPGTGPNEGCNASRWYVR